MRVESLRLIHLPKAAAVGGTSAYVSLLPGVFCLESCQRWLWLCDEATIERNPAIRDREELEIFSGSQAYLFLLRVATGLESQIVGETDIFGQLKEAWKSQSATLPADYVQEFSPWFQRLFEDTKEIRFRFLHDLGGASYGTLVRRLLKSTPERQYKPVLLIGAGQIAHAVAPYLMDAGLWLANRNRRNLDKFFEELATRPNSQLKKLDNFDDEIEAWKKAANVVVCVPLDPQRDPLRVQAWMQNPLAETGRVIHLGGLLKECGQWTAISCFHALDDLFALQKSQGEIRSVQIAQAKRACEERAKLRALGNSVTIPHGWEDLAAFA
jgi:hypothetical protein